MCKLRVLACLLLVAVLGLSYYFITLIRGVKFNGKPKIDEVSDVSVLPKNGNEKIIVALDVYYESLCPDSRSFFISELMPTVNKLSDYLQVNLIPYGRAETIENHDTIDFSCQHGPPECLGNKVHACIVEKALTNQVLAVTATTCLFEEFLMQPSNAKRCCQRYGISWDEVKSCAYGEEGSKLLKKYGEMTNKLLPIDFIPTIAINRVRGSKSYQAAILKNLKREVCIVLKKNSVMPAACE